MFVIIDTSASGARAAWMEYFILKAGECVFLPLILCPDEACPQSMLAQCNLNTENLHSSKCRSARGLHNGSDISKSSLREGNKDMIQHTPGDNIFFLGTQVCINSNNLASL